MSSDAAPPLLEAFPELQGKIPWIRLGTLPTPLHSLEGVIDAPLWIKRDDQSSPHYGGNKVRKLEFALAEAQRRGKRRVVTIGGFGTHHGLATAIHAARLGMGCTLILSRQPLTAQVCENLRLMHRFGAELVYGGSVLRTGARFLLGQRLRHRDAYFLYAGGSSPMGALGFVNAAFELKRQLAQGLAPSRLRLVCALGSSGTLAGLSLGVALAELDCEVIGVRVYPRRVGPVAVTTPAAVLGLMRRTEALLRSAAPALPRVELRAPRIVDGYMGQGYGYPTDRGAAAIELMRERAQIALEPTYTAKAFAGLLELAQAPEPDAPLLYWHTYNGVDLSSPLSEVDDSELPAWVRRIIEEAQQPA